MLSTPSSARPVLAGARAYRRSGRSSVVSARNGAKKERKAVSKRLQEKQAQLDHILSTLRSGTTFSSPQSLADVIAAVQQVGAEVEEIAGVVDGMSTSSSSSSSSDSDCDMPVLTAAPATPATDAREPEGTLQIEVPAATSSIETAPAGQLPGLPDNCSRLWTDTQASLGVQLQGQVMVCQGKSCTRGGAAEVFQAYSALAESTPGLTVGTCKCVDACGQAPALRLLRPDGVKVTLTSKDKPQKRKKKAAVGNIVAAPRSEVAVS